MKIAGRGGHSEDIRTNVFEHLKAVGHECLDVTLGRSGTSGADLSIPVSKANN